MKTFVIVSGNKYRSYLFRASWTEDLAEAEIYRDIKGAESSIRKMRKSFKEYLERLKIVVENEEQDYLNSENIKNAENIYQMFVDAKVVEVKIVLDEKN